MNIFIIDINLFLCYTNTRKQKARQHKGVGAPLCLRRWHRHLHNGKLRTVQATVYPFPAEKARGKGGCSHWGGVAFSFPFWNLLRYRVGLCACMVPFCFRDKWRRIVNGHRPRRWKPICPTAFYQHIRGQKSRMRSGIWRLHMGFWRRCPASWHSVRQILLSPASCSWDVLRTTDDSHWGYASTLPSSVSVL